jgi:hypothetical protein
MRRWVRCRWVGAGNVEHARRRSVRGRDGGRRARLRPTAMRGGSGVGSIGAGDGAHASGRLRCSPARLSDGHGGPDVRAGCARLTSAFRRARRPPWVRLSRGREGTGRPDRAPCGRPPGRGFAPARRSPSWVTMLSAWAPCGRPPGRGFAPARRSPSWVTTLSAWAPWGRPPGRGFAGGRRSPSWVTTLSAFARCGGPPALASTVAVAGRLWSPAGRGWGVRRSGGGRRLGGGRCR